MSKIKEMYYRIKGLSEAEEEELQSVSKVLTTKQTARLRELLITRKARLIEERFPVSASMLAVSHVAVPVATTNDVESKAFCLETSKIIMEHAYQERFEQFALQAEKTIASRIAPHLFGMEAIKEAIALQLVMPERFHILIIGDPGTGKTDLLRAATQLAPISSFGLGSGSSAAGLSVTAIGKEMKPGLLPQANGGLCALDELNLLKSEERGSLYNAMEKGFVTYSKGGVHKRFEADVRVLATANPKADSWKEAKIDAMRKQLPFDAALLSRFQLIFVVHKPGIELFRSISKQALATQEKEIKNEDAAFIKEFLSRARSLKVTMPSHCEDLIVEALMKIKSQEDKLLVEVTPRLVKGTRSLAMARARLALRDEVTEEDTREAISVLERSLSIGKPLEDSNDNNSEQNKEDKQINKTKQNENTTLKTKKAAKKPSKTRKKAPAKKTYKKKQPSRKAK